MTTSTPYSVTPLRMPPPCRARRAACHVRQRPLRTCRQRDDLRKRSARGVRDVLVDLVRDDAPHVVRLEGGVDLGGVNTGSAMRLTLSVASLRVPQARKRSVSRTRGHGDGPGAAPRADHLGRRYGRSARPGCLAHRIGQVRAGPHLRGRRPAFASEAEHRPASRGAEAFGVELAEVVRMRLGTQRQRPDHDLLIRVHVGQRARGGATARGARAAT